MAFVILGLFDVPRLVPQDPVRLVFVQYTYYAVQSSITIRLCAKGAKWYSLSTRAVALATHLSSPYSGIIRSRIHSLLLFLNYASQSFIKMTKIYLEKNFNSQSRQD